MKVGDFVFIKKNPNGKQIGKIDNMLKGHSYNGEFNDVYFIVFAPYISKIESVFRGPYYAQDLRKLDTTNKFVRLCIGYENI